MGSQLDRRSFLDASANATATLAAELYRWLDTMCGRYGRNNFLLGEGSLNRIDVIIPCYNYGRFLYQCVNSVLDQAGVDVRVLVIDDASPDNTAEITAALTRQNSRVTVIRHNKNKGHINTYNEGIEWASADYMLLLSADDYLLPGALRRAADLMDAHPEVGFAFGNAIELSDSGNETPTKSIRAKRHAFGRVRNYSVERRENLVQRVIPWFARSYRNA